MLLRLKLTFALLTLVAVLLAPLSSGAGTPLPRKGKLPPDLSEILSRMDDAGKRLRTLSENLEYTKVTVLVNDLSTEEGRLFLSKGNKGKGQEIRVEM